MDCTLIIHTIFAKRWPKKGEPFFVSCPMVGTWLTAINRLMETFRKTGQPPATANPGIPYPGKSAAGMESSQSFSPRSGLTCRSVMRTKRDSIPASCLLKNRKLRGAAIKPGAPQGRFIFRHKSPGRDLTPLIVFNEFRIKSHFPAAGVLLLWPHVRTSRLV